jgi:hypothetical protein
MERAVLYCTTLALIEEARPQAWLDDVPCTLSCLAIQINASDA